MKEKGVSMITRFLTCTTRHTKKGNTVQVFVLFQDKKIMTHPTYILSMQHALEKMIWAKKNYSKFRVEAKTISR